MSSMYLFFDAVSSRGCIALFNEQKELVGEQYFSVIGNEGKEVPSLIENFLSSQNRNYSDIQNIICVVGPGSFTGIRIVTLVVNTLAYVYPHISLTPLTFFDLYTSYPIVKTSSKRDLFVKWERYSIIEVIQNEDFYEKTPAGSSCFGNISFSLAEKNISLKEDYDVEEVFSRVILQNLKKIAPAYIKKPNIF